jgi:hypothetical protein
MMTIFERDNLLLPFIPNTLKDWIKNTYHMYKYLKLNTKLPENDIMTIVYDLINKYDVDLIIFKYNDIYEHWDIKIKYDKISIEMDSKKLYIAVFKLLMY